MNSQPQYRCIFINTAKGEITETTWMYLEELQGMVEGWIEAGTHLPNGDVVLVNEEGMLGRPQMFFEIQGAHQPFAGNGVVIGTDDESGRSTDAVSTLDEIKAKVKFKTIYQVAREIATEEEEK